MEHTGPSGSIDLSSPFVAWIGSGHIHQFCVPEWNFWQSSDQYLALMLKIGGRYSCYFVHQIDEVGILWTGGWAWWWWSCEEQVCYSMGNESFWNPQHLSLALQHHLSFDHQWPKKPSLKLWLTWQSTIIDCWLLRLEEGLILMNILVTVVDSSYF